jgi:hypothetical protein
MTAEGMEVPMKWTHKGHVPIASLDQKVQWKKEGRILMCHVVHLDKETGELMANDMHGYLMPFSLWERLKAIFADVKVQLKGQEIKAGQGNV